MARKVPALIGGVAGVAAATAATVAAHQRRAADRESTGQQRPAALGNLPVSRQRRVQANDGVGLHVEEVGPLDAPLTVLFVHGFTLNLKSLHFQRQALTERFGDDVRLVLFDLRSHGRSDRSAFDKCTLEQLGDDINSIIEEAIPTGPIVLIGHSMGGMAIMDLARGHRVLFRADNAAGRRGRGHRIDAVALLNSSSGDLKTLALGLPPLLAKLGSPVVPFVLRRAAKQVALVERTRIVAKDVARLFTKRLSFASDNVPSEVVDFASEMIAATPVDVVAAFYRAIASHDGRLGLLALGGSEVLVIGAEQDAMIPPSHCVAIAAALPHESLLMVPDAGHLLMLEHPDEVNKAIVGLVESALARARAVTA